MIKKKLTSNVYLFTKHIFHPSKGHLLCFHLLLSGTYSVSILGLIQQIWDCLKHRIKSSNIYGDLVCFFSVSPGLIYNSQVKWKKSPFWESKNRPQKPNDFFKKV